MVSASTRWYIKVYNTYIGVKVKIRWFASEDFEASNQTI